MNAKSYQYTINGKEYQVVIHAVEYGMAQVEVNGKAYEVQMAKPNEEEKKTVIKPQAADVSPVVSAPVQTASSSAEGLPVVAPLPGVVIEISCKQGDVVKAGQKVAVLEAMKMENVLNAPKAGTVAAIHVAQGDSVMEGTALLVIV